MGQNTATHARLTKCKARHCTNPTEGTLRLCDDCFVDQQQRIEDQWDAEEQAEYEASDQGQDEAAAYNWQDLVDRRLV